MTSVRRVIFMIGILAFVATPFGSLFAQSNWQQQQRQQDMQRQQQMQQQQQQAQQRQQMQDQQRQQMQAQQRQQMQDQQRQQMQAQQRQQMQVQQQNQQRQQMQQQTAEQQRRQLQQQGKLGTVLPGTNKPTGMVISGGVAKMNRPLTPGEIQRGFTGRVTADGRALIKFQSRIFTVPASRVSGLSARLTANQNEQRAPRWTAQQQAMANQRIKTLALSGGGGSPSASLSPQFNTKVAATGTPTVVRSALIQERIDSSRAYKSAEKSLAPKWLKDDGSIKWPPNDGFSAASQDVILKPGTKIDRYGDRTGGYFSPVGTPFEHRAIPEAFRSAPKMTFEVMKELPVKSGTAAPWFDQPGGGQQHQVVDMSVFELERRGYIKRIGD